MIIDICNDNKTVKTDNFLEYISKYITIESLDISGNDEVTDDGVKCLGQLQNLRVNNTITLNCLGHLTKLHQIGFHEKGWEYSNSLFRSNNFPRCMFEHLEKSAFIAYCINNGHADRYEDGYEEWIINIFDVYPDDELSNYVIEIRVIKKWKNFLRSDKCITFIDSVKIVDETSNSMKKIIGVSMVRNFNLDSNGVSWMCGYRDYYLNGQEFKKDCLDKKKHVRDIFRNEMTKFLLIDKKCETLYQIIHNMLECGYYFAQVPSHEIELLQNFVGKMCNGLADQYSNALCPMIVDIVPLKRESLFRFCDKKFIIWTIALLCVACLMIKFSNII